MKLQVILEQKSAELQYLHEAALLDSAYIQKLNQTITDLQGQVSVLQQALHYNDSAYVRLHAACRQLQRQVNRVKLRSKVTTVFAAVGAFSTGVGVAFIIIKTQ